MRQINFIKEIDRAKNILRQTHLSNHGRRENDAEHSWHLAIMAALLVEYANEEIDLAKTMLMLLLHDIVEIDAGDTPAYDAVGLLTQEAREKAAADRIYALLPEDQAHEWRALWDEFERNESPEARFAKSMDNFQPLLLNDMNGGSDWVEHGTTRAQINRRNRQTAAGSELIWDYMQEVLDRYAAILEPEKADEKRV